MSYFSTAPDSGYDSSFQYNTAMPHLDGSRVPFTPEYHAANTIARSRLEPYVSEYQPTYSAAYPEKKDETQEALENDMQPPTSRKETMTDGPNKSSTAPRMEDMQSSFNQNPDKGPEERSHEGLDLQNPHDPRPQVHHYCAAVKIANRLAPFTRANVEVAYAKYIPGVVWEEQRFFKVLTKTTGGPGSPSNYQDPSPQGFMGQHDQTSFIVGQAGVTEEFLPDFMFMIEPPKEFWDYVKKKKAAKVDARGQLVFEQWPPAGRAPRPLKDYPGLPDQISTKEKPWRIEMWRRLTGCQWKDILMRMIPETQSRTETADTHKRNSLNMLGSRNLYPRFRMCSWFPPKNVKEGENRKQFFRYLSEYHLKNNTTRGLTPGWIDISSAETRGNRVEIPPESKRSGQRLCGGRPKKAEDGENNGGDKTNKAPPKKASRKRKAKDTDEIESETGTQAKRARRESNTATPDFVGQQRTVLPMPTNGHMGTMHSPQQWTGFNAPLNPAETWSNPGATYQHAADPPSYLNHSYQPNRQSTHGANRQMVYTQRLFTPLEHSQNQSNGHLATPSPPTNVGMYPASQRAENMPSSAPQDGPTGHGSPLNQLDAAHFPNGNEQFGQGGPAPETDDLIIPGDDFGNLLAQSSANADSKRGSHGQTTPDQQNDVNNGPLSFSDQSPHDDSFLGGLDPSEFSDERVAAALFPGYPAF